MFISLWKDPLLHGAKGMATTYGDQRFSSEFFGCDFLSGFF